IIPLMNYPVASEITLAKAITRLAATDPAMAGLIARYGVCALRPHKNYYRELIESIIGQQLSVKAAASINRRFIDLFEEEFPSVKTILNHPVEYLREAGLSGAKARYVQDLAEHVRSKKLEFDKFDQMSNQDITNELVAVKGIGPWTADMFLIFCM